MVTCETKLVKCVEVRDKLYAQKRELKVRLAVAEAKITLPGRYKRYPSRVERWRGMVVYYADQMALKYLGRPATEYEIDVHLGIIYGESGGNPNAICRVEWEGTPPPGYDPTDPTTRASNLFQHVPAYWARRAAAAGFGGCSIFDVEAMIGTTMHMVYHLPSKAPNWRFWPDHPDGRPGSATKAKARIAYLYAT